MTALLRAVYTLRPCSLDRSGAGGLEDNIVRPPKKDPELRFRRWGKDAGGSYIYRERSRWWKGEASAYYPVET